MIISTAGHVNHGKTSLLKALTGIECDRLPEEKRRGLTIEAEFISAQFLGDDAFFVDVPGHEQFVRMMIAASAGVDAVLYAIDANEGVMPQTEEHAFILNLIGVKHVTVALTKVDKCDTEIINRRVDEVAAFFCKCGFADVKIIPVSIYDKNSVDELKKALSNIYIENNCNDKPFRLYADRSFSVKGAGTIVTGSLTRGKVSTSDILYVYPTGMTVRVKRIEKGCKLCVTAESGRVAMNLVGVGRDDVPRGSVLYHEGNYTLSRKFIGGVALRGEWRLKNNGIYNMFIGASKLRARYLEKTSMFILDNPFPLDNGDVFFIRGGSPETTIAGGHVISICAEIEREFRQKTSKRRVMKDADTEGFLNALDRASGYSAAGNLIALCGMDSDTFAASVKHLVATEDVVMLENYIMKKQLFDDYTALVRKIINDNGYADISLFKAESRLPRNIAAALLDKGDRLKMWRNEGNKRV